MEERADDKQNHCRTTNECECEELCLIRGTPLACGVFVISDFMLHILILLLLQIYDAADNLFFYNSYIGIRRIV